MCDGKWDCPLGEDEDRNNSCMMQQHCQFKFKCKNSHICVSMIDICDLVTDCPFQDDEFMCDIMNTCPRRCSCFLYALICRNVSLSGIILTQLYYSVFYFVSTDVTDLGGFADNTHCKVAQLSNNMIQDVCSAVSTLLLLTHLDVSRNKLTQMKKKCFFNLSSLHIILLNKNKITLLESNSFLHLNIISNLDLSENIIQWISPDTFENIPKIHNLNLVDNPLSQLQINMFDKYPVENFHVHSFHVCCITPPDIKCPAAVPWFTSCSDLFPDKTMRALFFSIALLVLSVNGLSFCDKVIQIRKRQGRHVFNVFVFFINSGDTLCGVYLSVIWLADVHFGNSFVLHDTKWRGHSLCAVAFALMLDFSLTMPFLLALLSIGRTMVVIYPFNSKFKSNKFVLVWLIVGSFSVAVATVAFTFHVTHKGKIPSSLCSPFLDPTDSDTDIKTITLIVISSEYLALIIMSIAYIFLSKYLKVSTDVQALEHQTSRKRSITLLLVLVTLSNLLCWIPSSAIFLSSLFQSQYSVDLVFWATTALVPVNSIINPLAFLSSSFRQGLSSVCQRKQSNLKDKKSSGK